MKVTTKYIGEFEINKEQIIYFNNGLPGFTEEKEFVLLPLSDDGVFLFLQSITNHSLAFITTNPFLLDKEYEFELTVDDQEMLNIEDSKDVFVQVIVTLKETLEESTANLKAPLIINGKQGKQVILHGNYNQKHKFFHSEFRSEESC